MKKLSSSCKDERRGVLRNYTTDVRAYGTLQYMILLRTALECDREFSRSLHHACYREVVERQFGAWDEELQDRFFADGWVVGESLIVEREGEPIGLFRRTVAADHIFIHEIQIHPDRQGQGIGSTLVREQIEEAQRIGVPLRLQVLRSNRAHHLYRRLGFEETGRNDLFMFMQWSKRSYLCEGVRRANKDDSRAIAEVHVRSWQAAYRGLIDEEFLTKLSVDKRQAMWEEFLRREPPSILVAERDSSVVGFCSFGPARDRDNERSSVAEIMALYVQSEYWSTGVGRALWRQALERMTADGFEQVILWVMDTNTRARAFYERIGFHHDGGFKSEQLTDTVILREVRYRRVVVR